MFTRSRPNDFEEILRGIPKTITQQMNLQLTQTVQEKEIKEALFSMQPNKAPRPDDDSFFFCKANVGEVSEIMRLIQRYGQASGQAVNFEKSSAFISKNITPYEAEAVTTTMRGIQLVKQIKYLGLPLGIGISRSSTMGFIKEKLTKRLNSWKGKLLNNVGKEVLLKSIALALPFYAMSIFKLPLGLCRELSKLMARFWWGSEEKKGKTTLKKLG